MYASEAPIEYNLSYEGLMNEVYPVYSFRGCSQKLYFNFLKV